MYLCISISLWATVFNSSSVKLFPTSLGMFSYKMQKPYYFTFKGSIEMFNTLRSFYSNSCLFCWPALFNCCVQNRFYHVLTTSLFLKSWNRELNCLQESKRWLLGNEWRNYWKDFNKRFCLQNWVLLRTKWLTSTEHRFRHPFPSNHHLHH